MNQSAPSNNFDIVIVGGGASGLVAGISAAKAGKSVLIAEKMKKPGIKLLATGGGRCNLTNSLEADEFMNRFAQGRFMQPSLELMGSSKLQTFFAEIGVETHAPDGFHIFPTTHKATTVHEALLQQLSSLNVKIETECTVKEITFGENVRVKTSTDTISCKSVIVSTGGLTYPAFGATGDGYQLAKSAGHKITPTFPAGVSLRTKEKWTKKCRADTIAKVKVSIKGARKETAKSGDLIFTKDGISGPVILDISREVTPLLKNNVTLLLQLTDKTQQDWQDCFAGWRRESAAESVETLLRDFFPTTLIRELCQMVSIKHDQLFKTVKPAELDALARLLTCLHLTAVGTEGYESGFITRGGVKLKEVSPHTLESKIQKGLFFCGEILDLDGPCGGYNLQWAFASGFLAGVKA